MPEITAAAVKALRERTGFPIMDCKRALQEAGGDADAAIEQLRKSGKETMAKRAHRETSFGRIAVHAGLDAAGGSIIELQCESAPVASNEDFVQLADDLARQLATGPGAATPEDLLEQPSPSKMPQTLKEQFDDATSRMREVFRLTRMARIDARCAGYVQHDGNTGVLLQAEGGATELARDVCMHIAAMRPIVLSKHEVDPPDPAEVEKERKICAEVAEKEGKPEEVETMVEDWLQDYYTERCLFEQPFVKDTKMTIAELVEAAGMKIVRFIHWELGKE